jgi:hypothetical protein
VKPPVVSKHHPFANYMREHIVPELPKGFDEILCRNTTVFHGSKNLFDARMITNCTCEILPTHLTTDPLNIEGWDSANQFVQERWISTIKKLAEPQVIEQNYLAIEHEIYFQANIHAVLRWESKTMVVNFRYLPKGEFSKVASSCAKKCDVYEMISGIFLINADGGVIVYDDAHRTEIFGVIRSPKLYQSIEKKCRWMRDCLLLGTVPPCRHLKKKLNH